MDLFQDLPIDADAIDHLAEPEIREAWPQTLNDLLDIFEAELRHDGIADDRSQRLAQRLTRALSSYCGGQQTYIPTGERLELAFRDKQIWRDFTGSNASDLARRHKLTERQIYNVLARQRALYKSRIQPGLF